MMTQAQRDSFAAQVRAAMVEKNLTAEATRLLAGIKTMTTMTKVTRGQNVHPETVGKLRDALGLSALTTPGDPEGVPDQIEVTCMAVGILLRGAPADEVYGRVTAIMAAAIGTPKVKG